MNLRKFYPCKLVRKEAREMVQKAKKSALVPLGRHYNEFLILHQTDLIMARQMALLSYSECYVKIWPPTRVGAV